MWPCTRRPRYLLTVPHTLTVLACYRHAYASGVNALSFIPRSTFHATGAWTKHLELDGIATENRSRFATRLLHYSIKRADPRVLTNATKHREYFAVLEIGQ